jgi:hypothetical protein
MRADTAFPYLLFLFNFITTSSYLFRYHLSSSAECFISVRQRPLASATDTSVDCHCHPSSTAIAQSSRLPWPIQEAGVHQLSLLHFFQCSLFPALSI